MNDWMTGMEEIKEKLNQFKDYAVSHPHLAKVDRALMGAINEPAGFAHVLVYGPSGVGKTTMINQIARRLNGMFPTPSISSKRGRNNGQLSTMPLLLLETRPSDGTTFNRADYYRTALKLLGEPFYERRQLVDVDTEQAWEKKGRSRSKASQFNDSPELRLALESALAERGVRAVILDEAQHLMKVGTGRGAGNLLDQLDWIKSMTNVTGVLHILIGTYELLNFQNLSGQASRRGLEIHFPRYLFQHQQERLDFQGVLLALLKQVPLKTDIPTLMQQWFYFYERSIGCVGVLKDWLIRTVAATLHDGGDTLSLEKLSEHALQVGQCERMAIDAIEGEQKLGYLASRREQLWRLLQMETAELSLSSGEIASTVVTPSSTETPSETGIAAEEATAEPAKTTRKKRSRGAKSQVTPSTETSSETKITAEEATAEPAKTTRKKRSRGAKSQVATSAQSPSETEIAAEESTAEPAKTTRKKRSRGAKTQVAISAETPSETEMAAEEATSEPAPKKRQTTKKRQTRKKTQDTVEKETDKNQSANSGAETVMGVVDQSQPEPASVETTPGQKKRRVGQRKPQRDPVGS